MTAVIPGMVNPNAESAAYLTGPYPDRWNAIQAKGTKKYPAGSFYDGVDDDDTWAPGEVNRNNVDEAIANAKSGTRGAKKKIPKDARVISTKDRLEVEKTRQANQQVVAVEVDGEFLVVSGHETFARDRIEGKDTEATVVDLSTGTKPKIAPADETPKDVTTKPAIDWEKVEAEEQRAKDNGYTLTMGTLAEQRELVDHTDLKAVNDTILRVKERGIPVEGATFVYNPNLPNEAYAAYHPSSDAIELNPNYRGLWRSKTDPTLTKTHEEGFFEAENSDEILIHELGHREHAKRGLLEFGDAGSEPLSPKQKKVIGKDLSDYGAVSGTEFVAEGYLYQMKTGEPLPGEMQGWYEDLNGPPVPKKQTAPTKWAPVMTEEDAKAYAREQGSVVAEQTFYHYTNETAVESISREGFRPGYGVFGQGIYLTDQTDAQGTAVSSEAVLRSTVIMKKPYISDLRFTPEGAENRRKQEEQYKKDLEAAGLPLDTPLDEKTLDQLGYDGVIIHHKDRDPESPTTYNGTWAIPKDTKQVIVTGAFETDTVGNHDLRHPLLDLEKPAAAPEKEKAPKKVAVEDLPLVPEYDRTNQRDTWKWEKAQGKRKQEDRAALIGAEIAADEAGKKAIIENAEKYQKTYGYSPYKIPAKDAPQSEWDALAGQMVNDTIIGHYKGGYSGSPSGIALEIATMDEFGVIGNGLAHVDQKRIDEVKELYPASQDFLRRTLRINYENTQAAYREAGVTHVTLVRGIKLSPSEVPYTSEELERARKDPTYAQSLEKRVMEMTSSPMSSFSSTYETAQIYSGTIDGPNMRTSEVPLTIEVKVPVERILSNYKTGLGSDGQREYLVLGGQDEYSVFLPTSTGKYPKP